MSVLPDERGPASSQRLAGNAVAVVGNPRPASRTAALAVSVVAAILDAVEGVDDTGAVGGGAAEGPGSAPQVEDPLIDLGDLLQTLGAPLGVDSARRYAAPLARLQAARLAVIATPTYKGSYTGLLKSFLDHVAAGGLRGVVAVPVITVGSPEHTLAADVHLRPLLIELGAVTPTPALVVSEADLNSPGALIADWLDAAAPALRRLLAPRLVDSRSTSRSAST